MELSKVSKSCFLEFTLFPISAFAYVVKIIDICTYMEIFFFMILVFEAFAVFKYHVF